MNIINFRQPVTSRIITNGIDLGEFNIDCYYKIENYNKTVSLKHENIHKSLKGLAVQTYVAFKNDIYEIEDFICKMPIFNKEYRNESLADYLLNEIIYEDDKKHKFKNENDLIYICYLYSYFQFNIKNNYSNDYFIKPEDIGENERYNLLTLAENTLNFLDYKNMKIDYNQIEVAYLENNKDNDIEIRNLINGEIDYITNKNTILDLKCLKRGRIIQSLIQQICYYKIGCLGMSEHGLRNDFYKTINEVGYYNAFLNRYVYVNINELPKGRLDNIFNKVLQYPLEKYIDKLNKQTIKE